MKILYEIKQKELYKYDGFKSFEQFIRSFVIAKTQAYAYLKVYEKVLEGVISDASCCCIAYIMLYNNKRHQK
ncbi:chromosome replication/partitioning protein [Borreliella lusitaniae]|uniref:chromosome replication/partitioning protein n=1 Tax=Borreliella lusitaniae TaxID=100177 RepID=UPI003AB3CEB2